MPHFIRKPIKLTLKIKFCCSVLENGFPWDKWVKVSALLCAWNKVREVANLVEVSRTTVYSTKKSIGRRREREQTVVESVLWVEIACEMLFKTVSWCPCANTQGSSGLERATVRRAVAKLGGKSLVRVKRPLLTPVIRAKRLERCQSLMNDLKFAQLVGWSSSQMRILGQSTRWETEETTATRQAWIHWTTPFSCIFRPKLTAFPTQSSPPWKHPLTGSGWPWTRTTLSRHVKPSGAVSGPSSPRMAVILNKIED